MFWNCTVCCQKCETTLIDCPATLRNDLAFANENAPWRWQLQTLEAPCLSVVGLSESSACCLQASQFRLHITCTFTMSSSTFHARVMFTLTNGLVRAVHQQGSFYIYRMCVGALIGPVGPNRTMKSAFHSTQS